MNCNAFQDIMSYSALKYSRYFGRKFRLHHQGQNIGQARNHQKMDKSRAMKIVSLETL